MASKLAMSKSASSVGMMEGAFFVSRTELLAWVNHSLQVSLTKVEQCASGAIFCQLLDACRPGSVAMRKVNWMAKADHEFIPNYKVLQAAFDRLGIEKHIDVDKLIRAKYQDNLEFLQWMKCYWDRERSACEDYDPLAPRESKLVPDWARPTSALAAAPVPRTSGASAVTGSPGAFDKENARPRTTSGAARAPLGAAHDHHHQPLQQRTALGVRSGLGNAANMPMRTPRGSAALIKPEKEQGALQQQAALLQLEQEKGRQLEVKLATQGEEMEEMRTALDGLERERDYYFKKLRQVEILCSTLQAHMECEQAEPDLALTPAKLVGDIQGILYAAEEDDQVPGLTAT